MGFRIDNINFRQAVKLPAGKYSYYMQVKPTTTSISFGYILQGQTSINTVTISGLSANVLQEVQKVFETGGVMEWFYPARQINAEIHLLTLNEGEKSIKPQPHFSDSDYYSEARIQILRDQINLKVSQDDFNSQIDILSDAISLKVSKGELLATGIDIEEQKITATTNQFNIKSNAGDPIAVFKLDSNGNPVLKAENIEFDGAKGNNVELTGKITATEGSLGALTMLSGGYIDLPPTFTSAAGRLDQSGLSLIYSGANSQKIEWYSGLGTFAGRITTDSSGHLNLLSDFGVKIEARRIHIGAPFPVSGSYIEFDVARMRNIPVQAFRYVTSTIPANATTELTTDVPLVIFTSVGTNAGLSFIIRASHLGYVDGDTIRLLNVTNNRITIRKSPSNTTNIYVVASSGQYMLEGGSFCDLTYYGGTWYIQRDYGQ